MCESLFATLEFELLARVILPSPARARIAVFDLIERRYNWRRLSTFDYQSPVGFEQQAATQ